jgi:hypothetical protein
MIPVLTPKPPYNVGGYLTAPDSVADFCFAKSATCKAEAASVTLENRPPGPQHVSKDDPRSTLLLLVEEMNKLKVQPPSCKGLPQYIAELPVANEMNCKRDVSAQLLAALRKSQGRLVRGDVALLEQRDIFYGNLPKGYTGYEVCPPSADPTKPEPHCALRVALDRVLWKGDFTERVMIAGSDLVTMLAISQQQSLEDTGLTAPDAPGKALATFGIVQPVSPNLSRPGSAGEDFPIQQDSTCGRAASPVADPSAFCVNGQPIRSDGAYWALTSDYLANDKAIYKVMDATKKDSYHEQKKDEFITGAIANALLAGASSTPAQPPARIAEWDQQQRVIGHVDIAKMVAAFMAREPSGGNIHAEQFQGAADTRASTPALQELDLESLSRVSLDLPIFRDPRQLKQKTPAASLGVQVDADYDRAATGNLTNKPPTVVYALNGFTVTPFVQFGIPHWKRQHQVYSVRELPRDLFVVTPVQYQAQFTGNFLVFPYSQSPPPTTPPTISGEYTAQAPRVTSHFAKAGFRHEFAKERWFPMDKGSYIEAGFEFGVDHNILSSVSLTSDGVTPAPCTAVSSTTIANCFAGYANPKSSTYVKGFQIDSTTRLAAPLTTATVHVTGAYWDLHFQKALSKAGKSATAGANSSAKSGINFTLDSKADWFSRRGAGESLNTQTRYAIPLSVALNFPVRGNLSLSPTYSTFLYSSQVTGQSIVINTASIEAKWYFARDASVPVRRQGYFRGPSSADQTSSAKMK